MKKILNISVIAALAILPMAANAEPIYDVTSTDPGTTNASGPEAANAPKYSLAAAGDKDDTHMATAGYVKGAYNAAIKAVNKVAATAADAANKDLSNLSDTGRGVITTAITNNAAGATYSNTTSGLTGDTLQEAIDELASEKANASTTLAGYGITDGADTSLSNITTAGENVIKDLAAEGGYDNTENYANGTIGATIKTLENTAGNAANQDLSNLSNTGKANVSAQGTYDSNATYTPGTVGAAIKSLQTSGATQTGVENTVETATITANVPTVTTWGTDATGTVAIQNVSISATYAEPTPQQGTPQQGEPEEP